jgi:DNA mismatch repair protein MutS
MVHSHNFYNLYQQTFLKYTQLYGDKVCVFLQKGSFYEFYGQEDPATNQQLNTGRQIIEYLGVVLHTYEKDGPNNTTGYYGGIPTSHLDKWAGKLTSQGWTVVVIEEVKNAAQKVTGREVTQVLSAGTHVGNAEAARSFFLASLWLDFQRIGAPPSFGVATADLTTGQVHLYEGSATGKSDVWHTDDLRHFFQVYPPRELILSTRGIPQTLEEETLRRTFHIPAAPIHMRSVTTQEQGPLESELQREIYMREMFQPRSALPLRNWLHLATDGSSLHERALVQLLRFAADHAPTLASCLQSPRVWHPTQSLQVINNALTQLNLIGSTPEQTCVESLFTQPRTCMGKRSLTSRLCSPVADTSILLRRQEEISWILAAPAITIKSMDSALSYMYDVARLHRTITRGTVTAETVVQLRKSYEAVKELWNILVNSPFTAAPEIYTFVQHCITQFDALFDVEKTKRALDEHLEDELGCLLDSVGPHSATTEHHCASIRARAIEWLGRFAKCMGVSPDAISFKPTDKNMFCVYTNAKTLKTIMQVIKMSTVEPIYKQTKCKELTSSGRVEHPALDDFQQELDGAIATLKRCKAVEVPEACIRFVNETRDMWQSIEDWIVQVDLALSMAKTSKDQGWVAPTIVEGGDETTPSFVAIENLRHPLIEVQKRQSKYVTHNIQLGLDNTHDGNGWLLYGMNASGKSSLMKAIGLAVLLAQTGCFVPATSMRLRPFRRLATRILNQDNLWAGLSSFAVEMSELREILAVADHQTLVLGDELCAGTESISGTAIVAAGIQHLHKTNARFVLATHLHDLMKLPQITSLPALKVWHLHVEYDRARDLLVYHRTLRPGSGSTMYGLEVAKALHLPHDMIEAAYEMRRALVNEAAVEEAPKSSWNADITRRVCSACGKADKRVLEVHHIQERADATAGRNADGTALNHVRNLAVLCQICHDKHHSQQLLIGHVEDTSQGPVRSIQDLSKFAFQPSQQTIPSNEVVSTASNKTTKRRIVFTPEQITAIRETKRSNPMLDPKLLAHRVTREHGFPITDKQITQLIMKGEL